MSSSRVQVLTLAEITLTILFALIIVSLPQIAEADRKSKEIAELKAKLNRAVDDLAEATRKVAALQEELSRLRSPILPNCPGAPVERLTVLGADDFVADGQHLTAQALSAKHVDNLRTAEQHECRLRVVVNWRDTLPASDFAAALSRLERYFRIVRGTDVETP